MRISKILMFFAALAFCSAQAAAGDLVINPFPLGQKPSSAPMPAPMPDSAAPMPLESDLQSPPKSMPKPVSSEEPISVTASEFMELDPDIVTEPLGRKEAKPVSKPKSEPAPQIQKQPEPLVEPAVTSEIAEPLPLLEAEEVETLEPVAVSDAPMEAALVPMAAEAQAPRTMMQKRPGLVYILDGQIVDDPAMASAQTSQQEQIMWSDQKGQGGWQAASGQGLRETLQAWSSSANITLIWEAPQNFPVIHGFSSGGSYENAVQNLLDQYRDSEVRPLAQLYQEPQTGGRVLVVRQYKAGT